MSDEKKEQPSVQDELEAKLDKLIQTKTGFERNRNLTGCVVALLGYYIYTGIRDGDGTWWFYLLMGVMFLVALFILCRSWKTTNEMQNQIDELNAEKRERDEAAAEEADDAEEPAAIEAGDAEQAAPADESAAGNQAGDADKA